MPGPLIEARQETTAHPTQWPLYLECVLDHSAWLESSWGVHTSHWDLWKPWTVAWHTHCTWKSLKHPLLTCLQGCHALRCMNDYYTHACGCKILDLYCTTNACTHVCLCLQTLRAYCPQSRPDCSSGPAEHACMYSLETHNTWKFLCVLSLSFCMYFLFSLCFSPSLYMFV